ncbi:MAG: tetratricopeptide repeat protein [candidate division Zixibacteria bacterium]|nr:tetratricopeptide repeat protein [candidate division Zixibacteria bacterium]
MWIWRNEKSDFQMVAAIFRLRNSILSQAKACGYKKPTRDSMKKWITILGLIFFLFSFSEVQADVESATALFQKGNESYEAGNFDQAIEEYQKVVDLGVKNSKVFYNLGSAHFRDNQLGKAILNYRRALSLDPRDEDSMANLRFAKLFTLDKIEEQRVNPLSNLLHWFLNLWSVDELTIFVSLSYCLSVVFGILILFTRLRKPLMMGLTICLVVLVIFSSSLATKLYFNSVISGVLIAPQAEVRSGPGKDYILQFTGHEGLEFRINEEAEGWYRISLPNGVKGWIPKEAVEII